ncbi:zinc finger protein-like isoform X6 [Periplaneta americana]|uniref:zinc finger protein-like isoform X6 n=1 Tax=Periplaneta americana TaxID=6978 RepID=UPI0037E7867C
MDVIKTEPEIDPLAQQNEDRIEEEGKSQSVVGKFFEVNVKEIKLEHPDPSYNHLPDKICEENEDGSAFPVMKFEIKDESCDLDIVKEEPMLDMTIKDDGSKWSMDQDLSGKESDTCEDSGIIKKTKQIHQYPQLEDKAPVRRDFKCELCGKAYTASYILKKHVRTHSGQKPFKCDICGKRFRQLYNLRQHIATHSDIKTFKCNICKKTFRRSGYQKLHMLIHSGEKLFECNICGKKFATNTNLKRHTRVHNEEVVHKCDVCSKNFWSKKTLQDHFMLTHTEEKPFKCDVCGIGFKLRCKLIEHVRSHTGEKPFKCNVCGKAFRQPSWLKEHARIHTGDWPFKCESFGLK